MRRTWNQARGAYQELDEIEVVYEAWMIEFYNAYHAAVAQGKRHEDVLEELRATIAPENQTMQTEIERWASGEFTPTLEEFNIEAYGRMQAEQEVGGNV